MCSKLCHWKLCYFVSLKTWTLYCFYEGIYFHTKMTFKDMKYNGLIHTSWLETDCLQFLQSLPNAGHVLSLNQIWIYVYKSQRKDFFIWYTLLHLLLELQINLFQRNLFLHQLNHNMTKDCSLNYKFSTWKLQAQNTLRTCFVHKFFLVFFDIQNNLCTQHVLNL